MVDVDGAVQVSNPRPLPTREVSEEDCAAEVAAADEAAEVAALDDVAATDDAAEREDVFFSSADAPTVIADPPPAAADRDEPEPDTCARVWATTFALARMERSPVSFVPYVAVTSTPAFGTSTWNRCVPVAAEAGSAGASGRGGVAPVSTMAVAGWMRRASVRPMADAGQFWLPLGVPR